MENHLKGELINQEPWQLASKVKNVKYQYLTKTETMDRPFLLSERMPCNDYDCIGQT